MVQVPPFLLRRLYVKGSLRNTPEGFQFQLKNTLGAGYAEKLLPLTIDGQEFEQEGISCLIFNAGSLGQFAQLSSSIKVDDGLLDVLVVNRKLESVLTIATNTSEHHAVQVGQHSWQGREITIQADPPQPLWLDGEHYGDTPATIKVVPKAIKVVVP